MCLIVVKPSGAELPSEDVLKTAWENNPDGFGLAYNLGRKQVRIVKGAMKFEDAIQMIRAVVGPKDKDIILHFRFATEGRIEPGNCHPFPISKSINVLKSLDLTWNVALVHNGIIPNGEPHKWVTDKNGQYIQLPRDVGQEKLSDTQKFIIERLSKMGGSLFNEGVLNLIGDYTKSKFALLDGHAVHLIGDFIEDGGCFYSNTSYKQPNYCYLSSFGWAEDGWESINYTGDKQNHCDLCKKQDATLYELEDGSIVCEVCIKFFSLKRTAYAKKVTRKEDNLNDDDQIAYEGP